MVRVLIGDMFASEAQTLVNTVNCVGVMGKGIALEFKRRFPDMFREYAGMCARGEVRLGEPYLHKSLVPPWILNFPTKDHWRSVAKLTDIVRGLEHLLAHYREWGITSIAVPPLGCGQGQLEWRIVGPTLYRYLARMDVPVELYAPYGTPHEELKLEFLAGPSASGKGDAADMPEPEFVRAAWVAIVEILRRIESEPFHWPVGRTAFQKIAYVATAEGIPTGLEFRRGSFGPYSPEAKQLAVRLVNNGLVTEERLGRMFSVRVGPTFQDARKAYAREIDQWEPAIGKTVDLFLRMNTRQAEIVSTVLFAAREFGGGNGEPPTERDVLREVSDWKRRRDGFPAEEAIAVAIRNLAALGWIKVKPSADLPLPAETMADAF